MNLSPHRHAFGHGITVRNVNEALPLGMSMIHAHGTPASSRGIDTLRMNGPVFTVYQNPCERVLFDPVRDANPFFHLFESLWILSGSNKVDMPKFFLGNVVRFSDNGETFHGAYGHRLRRWTQWGKPGQVKGTDQLQGIVDLLCEKPDTRQAVMSIWDPEKDLGAETKDMPCNDMVMFDIVDGRLNMTVCNRSNDIIWGAYGANAVQFSVLQEYVAAAVGVKVGYYTQMSNNYHLYLDNPYYLKWQEQKRVDPEHVLFESNPYSFLQATPMCSTPHEAASLLNDCEKLNELAEAGNLEGACDFYLCTLHSDFIRRTAIPMLQTYIQWKRGNFKLALACAETIEGEDWQTVCKSWVLRRAEKAGAK